MRNVHHVNFFVGFACTFVLNISVWHSHSSEYCLNTWLKYDSIFVNRWSASDLGGWKWVFCKNWKL